MKFTVAETFEALPRAFGHRWPPSRAADVTTPEEDQ